MAPERLRASVGTLAAAASLLAGIAAARLARADDFRFTQAPAGDGPFTFSWQDGGNWALDNPASSDHAFPGAAGDAASLTTPLNGPTTVNLNGPITLGTLAFDAGQPYTVDAGSGPGGAGGLTFQTAAGNAAITVTAGFGLAAHEVKAGLRLNAPLDVTVVASFTSLTLSGAIDNNGKLITVGGAADNLANGGISGGGGLTKTGGGRLTLSGTNTYGGTTTLGGGTLRATAVNAFSPNSAVGVAAGATLDLNNFSQTIGPLSGGGTVSLGTATLTVAGSGTPTTFSGTVGGSGGSVRLTGGILALTGSNTFTGGTAIDGGTLLAHTASGTTAASATGSSASAVAVNSGGTLAGTGTVSGPVSVNGGGSISAGDGAATPGKLTTGAQTWASGGTYVWKINNAAGAAGNSNGWDQLRMTQFNAMAAGSTFTVRAYGLNGSAAGAPANFNPSQDYSWPVAHADAGSFDTSRLVLDAGDVAARTGTPTNRFSLSSTGGDLMISYAAPEPSALGWIGFAGAGLLRRSRRGRS